jgi:hypothetical protein
MRTFYSNNQLLRKSQRFFSVALFAFLLLSGYSSFSQCPSTPVASINGPWNADFTRLKTYCEAGDYYFSVSSSFTEIEWSFSTGSSWTITSGQGTASIRANAPTNSPTTLTVKVKTGTCGTYSVETIKEIEGSAPSPAVITIDIPSPFCPDGNRELPISLSIGSQSISRFAELGMSSFDWEFPDSWGVENQTTNQPSINSINVIPAWYANGEERVKVTPRNTCGVAPQITLNNEVTFGGAPPAEPTFTNSTPRVCDGLVSIGYSTSVPNNGNAAFGRHHWNYPESFTLEPGSFMNTKTFYKNSLPYVGGEFQLIVENGCGFSEPAIINIPNGEPVPLTPELIRGPQYVCEGSTYSYYISNNSTYQVVPENGATSYEWILPDGWGFVGDPTLDSITVTAGSESGTIEVRAVNSCGSRTPRTFAVTAVTTTTPAPTVSAITFDNGSILNEATPPLCQSRLYGFRASASAGATSFTWSPPDGWFSAYAFNDYTNIITNNNSGNLSVVAANACGIASEPFSRFVPVRTTPSPANPTISISASSLEACGQTLSFTAIAENVGEGVPSWYVNDVNVSSGFTFSPSDLLPGDQVRADIVSTLECQTLTYETSNTLVISSCPNALNFDGMDDYVTITPSPELNLYNTPFTIEFWAKRSETDGTGTILSYGDMNGGTNNDLLEIGFSGSSLYADFGGNPFYFYDIPIDNNWHHYSVVFNADFGSGLSNLYLNTDGVQSGYSYIQSDYLNSSNLAEMLLGQRSPFAFGNNFNGTLDELRVWNSARTEQQIAITKDCQILPSQPNLIGYYSFNQGIAGGDNTGISSLTDNSAAGTSPGILNGFTLFDATSNFVVGNVSGECGNTDLTVSIPYGGLSYCQNDVIALQFQTSLFFEPGNDFKLQLSDASGSFASPTIIYEIYGAFDPAWVYNISLPTVAPGEHYRIRLVSTNPVVVGADNGTDLVIRSTVVPTVSLSATPSGEICPGTTVEFTASSDAIDPTFTWFLNGFTVQEGSANTYSNSTLSDGDRVRCFVSINPSCATFNFDADTIAISTSCITTTWYQDTDGDGFGNSLASTEAATQPAGYVANDTDCDDNVAAIYPGATEICDGLDNDCDGQTDEGVLTTFYRDQDNDGFGNPTVTTQACTAPEGYVSNNTDCDDERASVYPGATEICDGLDNDCDGLTDEGVLTTFYRDQDNDGFGNPTITTQACSAPSGYVSDNTDCDDSRSSAYPGATEICGNGIDDNCNGITDEGCVTSRLLTTYCGITLSSISSYMSCLNIAGAQNYRYLVEDGNGFVGTYESPNNSAVFRLSCPSVSFQTSYTVRVAVKRDGVWGPYGTPCSVTTPAAPTPSVLPSSCGISIGNSSTKVYFSSIAGAVSYSVELTNAGLGYSQTVNTGNTNTFFSLSAFTGLSNGASYQVRVAAITGAGLQAYGSACSITVDYTSKLTAEFCNYVLDALNRKIKCNTVANASRYVYKVTGPNSYSQTWISPDNAVTFKLSDVDALSPLSPSTVYFVSVAVEINGGVGSFGPACSVETPAIPTTALLPSYCAFTVQAPSTRLFFGAISGADSYTIEVSNSGLGYLQTYNTGNPTTNFSLSNFSGLKNGTSYSVRIAAVMGGITGGYGSSCNVLVDYRSALLASFCNITATSLSQKLKNNTVSGASNFVYRVTGPGGYNQTWTSPNSTEYFRLSYVNALSPLSPGITYSIAIAVIMNGGTGSYGTVCSVTTPPSLRIEEMEEQETLNETFIFVFPNPVKQKLNIQHNYDGELGVQIRTIEGKVLFDQKFTEQEIEQDWAWGPGMYFVQLQYGDKQKIVRIVKE